MNSRTSRFTLVAGLFLLSSLSLSFFLSFSLVWMFAKLPSCINRRESPRCSPPSRPSTTSYSRFPSILLFTHRRSLHSVLSLSLSLRVCTGAWPSFSFLSRRLFFPRSGTVLLPEVSLPPRVILYLFARFIPLYVARAWYRYGCFHSGSNVSRTALILVLLEEQDARERERESNFTMSETL